MSASVRSRLLGIAFTLLLVAGVVTGWFALDRRWFGVGFELFASPALEAVDSGVAPGAPGGAAAAGSVGDRLADTLDALSRGPAPAASTSGAGATKTPPATAGGAAGSAGAAAAGTALPLGGPPRVRGRVENQRGEGVPHAVVYFTGERGKPLHYWPHFADSVWAERDWRPWRIEDFSKFADVAKQPHALTDADGRFDLPRGTGGLVVHHASYLGRVITEWAPDRDMAVRLHEGNVVRGRVTGRGGHPLGPPLAVRLGGPRSVGRLAPLDEQYVPLDDDGKFRVSGLGSGEHSLTVIDPVGQRELGGVTTELARDQAYPLYFEIDTPGWRMVTLRLQGDADRLRDIEQVHLRFASEGGSKISLHQAEPGTWRGACRGDGLARVLVTAAGGFEQAVVAEVDLPSDGAPVDRSVVLPETSLLIRLRGESGCEPLAVVVWSDSDPLRLLRRVEFGDGASEVELSGVPPGAYRLVIRAATPYHCPWLDSPVRIENVRIARDEVRRIVEIPVDVRHVSVTVVDPDGERIGLARVQMAAWGSSSLARPRHSSKLLPVVMPVPRGEEHEIVVTSADGTRRASVHIDAAAEGPVTVTLPHTMPDSTDG